jgi:hypothetical protein
MRSVKNNDSICLLIEIHHRVDGIRCIEAHQLLVFRTRNNARLDNKK